MSTELEITGERAMPGLIDSTAFERLHRYAMARDVCRGKRVLGVAIGEGYGTDLLTEMAQSVTGVEIFESDKFLFHPDIELLRNEVNSLKSSALSRVGQLTVNPLLKWSLC